MEVSISEALLVVSQFVLHQVVFSETLGRAQLKVLGKHVLFALLSLRESEVGLVAILRDDGREFLLSLQSELLDNASVQLV